MKSRNHGNSFFPNIPGSSILPKMFLTNKYDLIHKASGWMLREVGKRNLKYLVEFLDEYYRSMPRTMLRYSIERLSFEQKEHYMTTSK
ncbi:MAG: DNA alkylation repair protein [Endomicrobium sp.]|nr:DNA alkylation repair protein [Endomicrobium sp.]